jgi:hypothetical protein
MLPKALNKNKSSGLNIKTPNRTITTQPVVIHLESSSHFLQEKAVSHKTKTNGNYEYSY